ncbi:phophatase 2C family protein [Coprinopsis cinerea AmutBmut pab1-1]|nr:phophatase 2C family protein [Coprinopsis cinerea AmutBmut pab1-1]
MGDPKVVTSCTSSFMEARVSITQYQPTGRPIEDRYSLLEDEGHRRLIMGVYDGHGGAATAHYISTELPERLLNHAGSHSEVFEELDRSLIDTFVKDHLVMRGKGKDWVQNAERIKAGCTALVCDIRMDSMKALISNAGDCRLIVCRRVEPGGRVTVPFQTVDRNAKSPSEQDRLRSDHPNEDMIIVGGRLFGKLMSTRGFGDGYYKLPIGGIFGKRTHKRYIDILSSIEQPGKVPMNVQYESYFCGYRTPPYVTARPETTSFDLLPGDTLVMASDGLWDLVSSDDVASIAIDTSSADPSGSLAFAILQEAKARRLPGDDVTIMVVELPKTCSSRGTQ